MALPTTIANLGSIRVGPFKSSAGNYYVLGFDASTTLYAMKATDPATSFSSAATATVASENGLSAFQVGDVLHLFVQRIPSATTHVYMTYDMASDTFSSQENAGTVGATGTTGNIGGGIVRRSDGSIVCIYEGATITVMGAAQTRIYYSTRTSAGVWTRDVNIDAGGSVSYSSGHAVLGASDATHLFWNRVSTSAFEHRALSSANVLQTASATQNGSAVRGSAVSFASGGSTHVAVANDNVGQKVAYFVSSLTPTISISAGSVGANATAFDLRFAADGADLWAVYANSSDGDGYAVKSTDFGATWGTPANFWTGTLAVLTGWPSIYQRGSNVVFGVVAEDSSTVKYNEYTVRTTASPQTVAPTGFANSSTPGSPTLGLTIAPSGIATASAIGAALLSLNILATGFANVSTIGSPTVGAAPQTVAPTGFANSSTPGSPTLTLTIAPAAVANASAYGSPSLVLNLGPTGFANASTAGAPVVGLKIAPAAVANASTPGSPTLGLNIGPAGVANVSSLGSPVVSLTGGAQTVSPAAVVNTSTPGSPTLALNVGPTGFANASAAGAPAVKLSIAPAAVEGVSAYGSPTLGLTIAPAAVVGVSAYGSPTLGLNIAPAGVATSSAIGTPVVSLAGGPQAVSPAGVANVSTIGSPSLGLNVGPTGFANASAPGAPAVKLTIGPTAFANASAAGSPTLGLTIAPAAVVNASTPGAPTLRLNIAPAGVVNASAAGSPSLGLNIAPAGLANASTIGAPVLRLAIEAAGVVNVSDFGVPTVTLGVLSPDPTLQGSIARGRASGGDLNGRAAGGATYGRASGGTAKGTAPMGERINWAFDVGEDWVIRLTCCEADGETPMDLTGGTVALRMQAPGGEPIDVAGALQDPVGEVLITVTPAQQASITADVTLTYTVRAALAGGRKSDQLFGTIRARVTEF